MKKKILIIVLSSYGLLFLGKSNAATFWYCVKDIPATNKIAEPMFPFTNDLPQKAYINNVVSSNAVTCRKINIGGAGADLKSSPMESDSYRGSWEINNRGSAIDITIKSASQDPARQFGGLGSDQFVYVGGFVPTTVTIAGKKKQVFLLEPEGIVPFSPVVTPAGPSSNSGTFSYQQPYALSAQPKLFQK